jgi:cation-transporting P-type ATPase F
MIEILYLFNCRSLTRPIWQLGWFSNPWVWAGIGATLALQGLFTYLPALQALFGTAAIGVRDWIMIVCVGALAMLIVSREALAGAAHQSLTLLAQPFQ